MKKWKKLNSGVKDLWVGTLLFFLVFTLIGLFVVEQKGRFALGLFVGSITTAYLVYHMYESIDAGLSLDEEAAAKYLRNKSMQRWLIRLAVVFVSVYIPYVSVVGVMVGMFALKFSAYFQPWIHKLVLRLDKNKKIVESIRKE